MTVRPPSLRRWEFLAGHGAVWPSQRMGGGKDRKRRVSEEKGQQRDEEGKGSKEGRCRE